jgi:hypothetical protein
VVGDGANFRQDQLLKSLVKERVGGGHFCGAMTASVVRVGLNIATLAPVVIVGLVLLLICVIDELL